MTASRDRLPGIRPLLAMGLLLLTIIAGLSAPAADPPRQAAAAQQDAGLAVSPQASTCGRCHSQHPSLLPLMEEPRLIRHDEFDVWKEKDPHSRAYTALGNDRSREIAAKLELKASPAEEAQCLSCHATGSKPNSPLAKEGVGCVACHGEQGSWITGHALGDPNLWMKLFAEKKSGQGMNDLRDPATRADVCLSCHVGDSSPERKRVITHDMFAAGHPPLRPIEVMNYSEGMPVHWDAPEETPYIQKADKELQVKGYHYDPTQAMRSRAVALAGVASLRRVVAFLGSEAKRVPGAALDFARFDCAACHHELQVGEPGSARQLRGFQGAPGRPPLGYWPQTIPLARLEPDASSEFTLFDAAAMQPLFHAVASKPFGDSAEVDSAAEALDAKLADGIAKMRREPFTRRHASELLHMLEYQASRNTVDYDSACQMTWAIRTIMVELDKAAAAPNQPAGQRLNKINAMLGVTVPNPDGKPREWLPWQSKFKPLEFQELFR